MTWSAQLAEESFLEVAQWGVGHGDHPSDQTSGIRTCEREAYRAASPVHADPGGDRGDAERVGGVRHGQAVDGDEFQQGAGALR